MRVRIIFKLKNKGAHLPFHHQHLLAQFLKGAIVKGGNAEFADYPYFNFSGLKGQTKVSRNGLQYLSNFVTLVVSSSNEAFIDYLLAEIFEIENIELGQLSVTPLYTEKETLAELSNENKFICISPLVPVQATFYEDHGKRFIKPEADEFSDLLYESTMRRMEATGQYSQEQLASFNKFQLVPDLAYLNRMRAGEKKFSRIYALYDMDVKYEVRGYTMPFTLYAAPEVQQFIFECGLGNYTYKGFGMLDIANVNPVGRTQRYSFSRELVTA